MGSDMSANFFSRTYESIRKKLKRRTEEEEHQSNEHTASKQRCIGNSMMNSGSSSTVGAPFPFSKASSTAGGLYGHFPADAFPPLKPAASVRNFHQNHPAKTSTATSDLSNAYANGLSYSQQLRQTAQQQHYNALSAAATAAGSSSNAGNTFRPGAAKSPPPQLLPARRYTRVPPSLLPINNGASAAAAASNASSYGFNNGLAAAAATSGNNSNRRTGLNCFTSGNKPRSGRFLCSTPRSSDMSLRRLVLANHDATAECSAINGIGGTERRAPDATPTTMQTATTAQMATTTAVASRSLAGILQGLGGRVQSGSDTIYGGAGARMNFSMYKQLLNTRTSALLAPKAPPIASSENCVPLKSLLIDLCNDDTTTTTTADPNMSASLSLEKMRISETEMPKLPPINSIQANLQNKPEFQPNFVDSVTQRYSSIRQSRAHQLLEAQRAASQRTADRTKCEHTFRARQADRHVPIAMIITPDDELDDEPAVAEIDEFPAFTHEQAAVIQNALRRDGPGHEVLITKFNLSIRRANIQTLSDLNWLDDEVINFYMELLVERSRRRTELPKVYAFNTFFLPRLSASGHAGVKRWTRKVDIFAYDIIPVPVHVGGVHWCMAIIDLRRRTIRYFDSMISRNPAVLQRLADYLVEEARDKKGEVFDMSGWQLESMLEIPRQNNQSDCGVFSCAFAETLTRDGEVRFTQQNMPWMRMKMVLEICSGELIL